MLSSASQGLSSRNIFSSLFGTMPPLTIAQRLAIYFLILQPRRQCPRGDLYLCATITWSFARASQTFARATAVPVVTVVSCVFEPFFVVFQLHRQDLFWQSHENTAPTFPEMAKKLVSDMLIVNPSHRYVAATTSGTTTHGFVLC